MPSRKKWNDIEISLPPFFGFESHAGHDEDIHVTIAHGDPSIQLAKVMVLTLPENTVARASMLAKAMKSSR